MSDNMELFKAIKNRRSIRKYKDDTVEHELIEKVVEAGIWAPSAGDLQSWDAVVVKDEKTKFKITAAAYFQDFVLKAPVLIAVCANKANAGARYGDRGRDLYCIQDASCAALNMMLRAYDLGLGSAWVGAFKEEEVSEALILPTHIRPVALITIGYPDEEVDAPSRRSIEKVIHKEKY